MKPALPGTIPLGPAKMFLTETPGLVAAYGRYFEIVPAFSDALKDQVFRVRHDVYCEEFRFESVRPNRREMDEYDSHSLHALIRSVQTGEFIGCVRIVLASPHDPLHPLPFEKLCNDVLNRSIVDPAKLPRDNICEVSRLAVISRYRRRKGDKKDAPICISDQDFGTQGHPRFPFLPVSLYFAAIELARLNNVRILFTFTESRLLDHFRRIGFAPEVIGGPTEHHGRRVPAMMDVAKIVANLKPLLLPLYRAVAEEVRRGV